MNRRITALLTVSLFIISVFSAFPVYADNAPVRVTLTGDTEAEAGKTVTLNLGVNLKSGANIQGVQVDFEYSDKFPEFSDKGFSIEKNTTGWTYVGTTKENLLGVGDVLTKDSIINVKISFKIPSDASEDTKYVFKISKAIGAAKDKEISADIDKNEWTVKVKKSSSGSGSGGGSGGGGGGGGGGGSSFGGGAAVAPSVPAIGTEWTNPFGDVGTADWFYDSVKFVYTSKLMNGTAENAFSPDVTLTRAMLVTILYRNEGEPAVSAGNPFADVASGAYYEKAVTWAKETGIVNGYTEMEFAPEANITREQIAAIMYRYAGYKGYDVSAGANANISSYTDYSVISDYAVDALRYMVGSGLMKGKTENTLNPSDNATRAETATILKRFVEANK